MRSAEPEDNVRDAHVFAVLLDLLSNDGLNAVGVENFKRAMQAHIRLLRIEGVDTSRLFYGDDHVVVETTNALNRAIDCQEMSSKVLSDGYYYFEPGFRVFAEKEIQKHLDEADLPRLNAALETTGLVYAHSRSWADVLERIEEHKRKKLELTVAK